MTERAGTILQLDFDGTLVEGDASTGILARFVDPSWRQRVEAASHAMRANPDGPDLIDTMAEGYALLAGDWDDYVKFARTEHAPRAGLRELIEVAERYGVQSYVISNGFEFYIREYLRLAGVERLVEVHTGHERPSVRRLVYSDPDGNPVRSDFKAGWARHLRDRCERLIYVGDGASDVGAASLAHIVFARDSLLTGMPPSFQGALQPFEDLHDVARGLEMLFA